MHHSSMHRMERFVNLFLCNKVTKPLTIIDFGSQSVDGQSYRPLFSNPNWTYVGVDITAGHNVNLVLKDTYKWDEIETDSVDVVISGQAFEHVEYIWMSIQEIGRIMKPDGLCCLIAPSGKGAIHRYPVDCWRIQPDGWLALAKYAGLRPLVCQDKWESLPKWKDGSEVWDDVVFIATKDAGSTS